MAEDLFETPFNVLAAFPRREEAEQAERVLIDHGIPRSAVSLREPHTEHAGGADSVEEIALLKAEIQAEVAESWAAPAFIIPEPQARGAFWAAALVTGIFLVIGLIVGVVWAAAFDSTLNPVVRVLIPTGISGLTGGTIGFLAGGGIEPRIRATGDPNSPIDDPPPVAERDFILAVRTSQREASEEIARLLRTMGSERVYVVDAAGTLLGAPPPATSRRTSAR